MQDCLFEYYENQTPELKKIVDKYLAILEHEMSYPIIKTFLKEVEKIGYTFDYGLCGTCYDLRKI